MIPMEKWGRDHWSTLAYLETRCVDYDGKVKNENLRCDSDLHPNFAHSLSMGFGDRKYPTRLVDGTKVENHDDWSCIEDFIDAKLVIWKGTGLFPIFELTDLGWEIAGQIRRHLSKDHSFASFKPQVLTKTK